MAQVTIRDMQGNSKVEKVGLLTCVLNKPFN